MTSAKVFEKPIQLYSAGTPNGDKIHIFLEEAKIAYEPHTINIQVGEQLLPEFIKLSPNNRIPAIVDPNNNDLAIFESAAILIYLADKTGLFLPKEGNARYEVLEWVMWQMGGVGPMIGQYGHFSRREEKIEYAIDRYKNEVKRLFRILNKQLAKSDAQYVAGGAYSIADFCLYPWAAAYFKFNSAELADYEHIKKYIESIREREAVKKAETVCRASNIPGGDKAFGTFPKPADHQDVGIYDVKKHLEREDKKQ